MGMRIILTVTFTCLYADTWLTKEAAGAEWWPSTRQCPTFVFAPRRVKDTEIDCLVSCQYHWPILHVTRVKSFRLAWLDSAHYCLPDSSFVPLLPLRWLCEGHLHVTLSACTLNWIQGSIWWSIRLPTVHYQAPGVRRYDISDPLGTIDLLGLLHLIIDEMRMRW